MNRESTFAAIVAERRDSRHWSADEISWGTLLDWAANPADRKACGNYVLGTFAETTVTHPGRAEACTGLHRRKSAVVSRSALTLDVDYPEPGFVDAFDMVWGHAALLHSTWSATSDAPRYRLIIPLDRDVAPDEYVAAASVVMDRFGAKQFDPGSTQPERYMFKPSASDPSVYEFHEVPGEPVSADDLLADFDEDLSGVEMPRPNRTKRDPFQIEGTIGAFNRAYTDWDLLIEEFNLPYESAGSGRYHHVGARSASGMGPIAGVEGLVYSHHLNDPAYGVTCSAFDLVRLHKFSDLDEGRSKQTPVNRLPSTEAMLDLAIEDERVVEELARGPREDFSPVSTDDLPPVPGNVDLSDLDDGNQWKINLDRLRGGSAKPTAANRDLIIAHDPVFRRIAFDSLRSATVWTESPPWRSVDDPDQSESVSSMDEAYLHTYLENEYGLKVPKSTVADDVSRRAALRNFNPVRDYLSSLSWDGVPRVEECLPGVAPTSNTRLIARKALVAAVARVFEPGCKWDHTLVLSGPEGLGKSWWIHKMSRGWTATLGSIHRKDTLLTLHKSWIVVSDEGHEIFGTSENQANEMKEFLTRTVDEIRAPYTSETVSRPRRSVIWATTNDERMLRKQQGNRRFLVVKCDRRVDFDALTDHYIDQVWAEAVALYRAGERLYLDSEESVEVAESREDHIQEDALYGIIEEYLDQRVPESWETMSTDERRRWMSDRADGMVPDGPATIDTVCSAQIWCEALGMPFAKRDREDLLKISKVLDEMPGWVRVRTPNRTRVANYGTQSILARIRDEYLI